MLHIALTCPPWWVARWTARMLTSLAVVLAFSLGATSLPFDAAVPADVAGPVAPAWSPPGFPTAGLSPAATPAGSAPTTVSAPKAVSARTAGSVATDSTVPTAGVDALGPADAAWPAPAGPSVAVAAGSQQAPAGSAPAASGPRAPPRA
ncbi:hypothetical protein [Micromonospora okii]|uniref:hypothetical protein n=1 Tax=Micromonospora okii TaxID=1182970 RepID=UPI001E493EC6|nr:hypothetical protein [Micromonospora okii]